MNGSELHFRSNTIPKCNIKIIIKEANCKSKEIPYSLLPSRSCRIAITCAHVCAVRSNLVNYFSNSSADPSHMIFNNCKILITKEKETTNNQIIV